MGKKGYGLKPGLGIYRKGRYPSYEDVELPEKRGVPRDPATCAWKSRVMRYAWDRTMELIQRGMEPRRAFSQGLREAYARFRKP